jgi:hypothetical protein
MGKKPIEREVKTAVVRAGSGFDSSMPCSCCGAPSRHVRPQWRACSRGHRFIRKSDQR